MALETRWYDDCERNAYRVLVMDPETSGVTWEAIEAMLNANPKATLPDTVYRKRWGREEATVTQEAHIEMCKAETLLLAERVLTPAAPQTVLLRQ
jgi:hypothetical protein